MQTPEARIAFLVRGVVLQALHDAGVSYVKLPGCEEHQRELVLRWCDVVQSDGSGNTLMLSTSNKTELLLGRFTRADVYPLGDLYASDVEQLCGRYELSVDVQRLADAAGGVAQLDRALRGLLEERRDHDQAFAHIAHLRDDVLQRLDANRFGRAHPGVVPKIGARTLGIDLFI
jgi:hypothetical protein